MNSEQPSFTFLKIILLILLFLVVALAGFNFTTSRNSPVNSIPTFVPKASITPSKNAEGQTGLMENGTVESISPEVIRIRNQKGEIREFQINDKTNYYTRVSSEKQAKRIKKDPNPVKVGDSVSLAYLGGRNDLQGSPIASAIIIITP